MSPQTAFRHGQPASYVATRSFDLGTTGLKIQRGDEFAFDGTVVTIPGCPPVSAPQMRGAIRVGWVVPAANFNENDHSSMLPVSANVQVRPAEGGNPMDPQPRQTITAHSVAAEEQEVGNVQAHARRTAERNQTNYRRGAENRAVMASSVTVIEEQDGVPVRSLRTPTHQIANPEKMSVGEAERMARVQPGVGRTREEVMDLMDEEERAEYEQEILSRKIAYDPNAAIVGRVAAPKTVEHAGFTVTTSVGGGSEAVYEPQSPEGAEAATDVVYVEGIKMTTTNGSLKKPAPAPQAPVVAGNPDVARQIAKRVCPDFPDNYVFTDPLRKKIARLQADFDDRPDVILAVAAADTDPEVRARLMQEFPEAFGA